MRTSLWSLWFPAVLLTVWLGLGLDLNRDQPAVVGAPVTPLFERDFKTTLDLNTGIGPAITFLRSSTRTCVNASQVMVILASNVPCFNHNPLDGTSLGLLTEPQRTNSALEAANLTVTWTNPGANTTITVDAGADPFGTTTADDVLHDDSAETIQQTITSFDDILYNISAFVAQGDTGAHDFVKIAWIDESDGANGFEAWFDISDGSLGTAQADGSGIYLAESANIVDWGNGLYRVSAGGQIPAGKTDARFELINTTADAVDTAETTNSVYWFGMQATLAINGGASSYIPTTTMEVIREQDSPNLTNLDFLIDGVGTILWIGNTTHLHGFNQGIITLSDDGAALDRIDIRRNTTNTSGFVTIGGVGQVTIAPVGTWAQDTTTRIAVAYALNDFAAVKDAGTIQTDTTDFTPPANAVIDEFRFGSLAGGGTQFAWHGHHEFIAYYGIRQPNGTLTTLTTAANDNGEERWFAAIGY